jgi:hypothetical protein
MVPDYHRRLKLRIDLSAKTHTISPATSKAAPASKLMPELELLIETHINTPRPIAAAEIIISKRWVLSIATRVDLICIVINIMVIL